jgi:hypothetical protein
MVQPPRHLPDVQCWLAAQSESELQPNVTHTPFWQMSEGAQSEVVVQLVGQVPTVQMPLDEQYSPVAQSEL